MVGKIMFDISKVDLGRLFKIFQQNEVEFCLTGGDCVWVHVKDNTSSPLIDIMKEANIANYFIKEHVPTVGDIASNYGEAWANERFALDERARLEKENQKTLKKIESNIRKLRKKISESMSKEESNERKKD